MFSSVITLALVSNGKPVDADINGDKLLGFAIVPSACNGVIVAVEPFMLAF